MAQVVVDIVGYLEHAVALKTMLQQSGFGEPHELRVRYFTEANRWSLVYHHSRHRVIEIACMVATLDKVCATQISY